MSRRHHHPQQNEPDNPFADSNSIPSSDPLYPSSNPHTPNTSTSTNTDTNNNMPRKPSSAGLCPSTAKNFTFPGFQPPPNSANSSTYTGNTAIDGGSSSNAPGVSSTNKANPQEYPSVYDPEGVYGKYGAQQVARLRAGSLSHGGGAVGQEAATTQSGGPVKFGGRGSVSLRGGQGRNGGGGGGWGSGDPDEVSADGSRTVSANDYDPEPEHTHGMYGSRTLTGGHEDDRGSSGFNRDVERLGHGLKEGIESLRSR